MEIAATDGTKFHINSGDSQELGRGNGIHSADKTISRRQIAFSLPQFSSSPQTLLQFQVLGRNPVYVSRNDGDEVKVFRTHERGEMESGDKFCLSAKDPIWYSLKGLSSSCAESVRRNDLKTEFCGELGDGSGIEGVDGLGIGDVDVSCIDPVTEFGFLVIGHEFDSYPKKMIRDMKNWDWFLEEVGRGGDDDDDDDENDGDAKKKGKRRGGKKRKKGAENDDEDWSGESEDDKVLINNPKNFAKPKYTTRSKDRAKHGKGKPATGSSSSRKQTRELDDEDEDDDMDEDDETLGGFIVDDEKLDEDEDTDNEEEEEEEEEFVDEDDE